MWKVRRDISMLLLLVAIFVLQGACKQKSQQPAREKKEDFFSLLSRDELKNFFTQPNKRNGQPIGVWIADSRKDKASFLQKISKNLNKLTPQERKRVFDSIQLPPRYIRFDENGQVLLIQVNRIGQVYKKRTGKWKQAGPNRFQVKFGVIKGLAFLSKDANKLTMRLPHAKEELYYPLEATASELFAFFEQNRREHEANLKKIREQQKVRY